MIWHITASLPPRRASEAARRAGEVRVEDRGDPLAGLQPATLQVEEVPDLLQAQIQGLGAADEVQDRDVVGGE